MARALAAAVVGLLLFAGVAHAQSQGEFRVVRAAEPPKIDGVLDDAVWTQPPLALSDWISYNPMRGDKAPAEFRTDVRVSYDDRNIYFAFHCFDHEPERIRTNVSRRDSASNDDWIAISLDSAGTGQTAYHLFSNPSGSQLDALNTSSSGEQFDADLVWYSVGRTTSDGYVVEFQVPLQTLRFKGAAEVRMGLVFFRKVSRIGISYAWPEMLPGQWVFDRPAHLIFENIKPRRLVELLPSVTYGVNQVRETAAGWNAADGDPHIGISGKLGITSGITLDGTINPDFSQVESDAFQVEVNQRFPVFYSEKRPFFMEGMGLFNIAGAGGPGNLRTAVHTRKIVDPIWGSKVTGTLGKTTFGVLNSLDDHPENIGGRDEELVSDRNKMFTIGRATYALRRSDYLGAILTQTEHVGRSNFAAGGDLSIRPSSTQQVTATFLTTRTSEESIAKSGNSAQVSYGYETRRFQSSTQVEHYDPDFQMDTAFYNRTGFTSAWSYNEINFYPRADTGFWLQRIHPFLYGKIGHDRIQGGDEDFFNTGIQFNTTRQGFFEIAHSRGHEPWQGQRFDVGSDIHIFSRLQVLRWLNFYAGYNAGESIYYDEEEPFQGRHANWFDGFELQPNQHITQSVDYNRIAFDRASTGERVYTVDIINSKTTYQFNKHFLVRFLAQYDSSARRVLTDFLASYEFVPGTVFHAGYGSLYERRLGANGAFVPVDLGEKYLTVNRGLFFKASYLRRF